MTKYGYGQEQAINELLEKYYKTHSPKLLTGDNREWLYLDHEFDYDAYRYVSEVPDREFIVKIDSIKYTSAYEASLQVTYTQNSQVLNQKDEMLFEIRNEGGEWKISHSIWMSQQMDLPTDIDNTASNIVEKQNKAQLAVLSDLKTYYKAYNEENLDLTLQYTSPSFIRRWDAKMMKIDSTWEKYLRFNFDNSETRYKLSKERVVFIGEKDAVVQGMLDWSDSTEGVAEGDVVFEALIYLEYANGHWNYRTDLDIDQDYNYREEYAPSSIQTES
ncbi:hypothetical protein SAMN04487969_112109 [Paenibacillus algorifonticola]|uniref:Uncharacterized protein n=1 Tax=Paenibacillus algorifonticola TaxID=684063 RepID=A0A1I2FI91_9BACL|nr:hypothetical protein [Paenibacillus algorifonticola]SFF05204.1 hypothetical protein SAMN04487969_112109 [Paenibacillus algorifonticola]